MVPEVLVAHPEDPVEETAKVLRDNKIGAMPVMDDGRLVGIVTGKGASSRLEVELVDRPGALAGLLDRVASRNINVSSVLTARADEASVTFVLRVGTLDGHGLAAHLRGLGYNVLWPPETTEA